MEPVSQSPTWPMQGDVPHSDRQSSLVTTEIENENVQIKEIQSF
jgi:hypothetical protein